MLILSSAMKFNVYLILNVPSYVEQTYNRNIIIGIRKQVMRYRQM